MHPSKATWSSCSRGGHGHVQADAALRETTSPSSPPTARPRSPSSRSKLDQRPDSAGRRTPSRTRRRHRAAAQRRADRATLYAQLGLTQDDFFAFIRRHARDALGGLQGRGQLPCLLRRRAAVYSDENPEVERHAALGGAQSLEGRKRDLASSPPFRGGARRCSQRWCKMAIAKPGNTALFPAVDPKATSAASAADIKKNIAFFSLHFLSEPATVDDVDDIFDNVFVPLEAAADSADGLGRRVLVLRPSTTKSISFTEGSQSAMLSRRALLGLGVGATRRYRRLLERFGLNRASAGPRRVGRPRAALIWIPAASTTSSSGARSRTRGSPSASRSRTAAQSRTSTT